MSGIPIEKRVGLLLVFASRLIVILSLFAWATPVIGEDREERSGGAVDSIMINAMQVFGDLVRPEVTFPHDRHVRRLEKDGKDCMVCHRSNQGKFRLQHLEDLASKGSEQAREGYHDFCIDCHDSMSTGFFQTTGPQACGQCHRRHNRTAGKRHVLKLDPSLHHRHIESFQGSCVECHHGFSIAKQKTYAPSGEEITASGATPVDGKGHEMSCRVCHKTEARKGHISYRLAVHQACVACHLKSDTSQSQPGENKGPISCSGCHDPAKTATIEKLDPVPRLFRNQPDFTVIKNTEMLFRYQMKAVVFNHRIHEAAADSCMNCHHENMNRCEKCHQLGKASEKSTVMFEQAMHKEDSITSCVGCHNRMQEKRDCAGCHSLIGEKKKLKTQKSCANCHTIPLDWIGSVEPPENLARLAYDRWNSRPEQSPPLDSAPKEVLFEEIADRFEAAVFPHQQVLEALLEGVESNRLAMRFHSGGMEVCSACHHDLEESRQPQKCTTCHAKSPGKRSGPVPDARAAFHTMCFQCHDAMAVPGLKPNDCDACHFDRSSSESGDGEVKSYYSQ